MPYLFAYGTLQQPDVQRATFGRLLDGENGIYLSQVNPSFLSLGTQLQDQVANPFFGIITNPSSPLRFATVERNRLLRPYPQYDGVTGFRIPAASSIYHGGTVKVDKRFSSGTSFLVAYTWSKLIDNSSTTVGFLGQRGLPPWLDHSSRTGVDHQRGAGGHCSDLHLRALDGAPCTARRAADGDRHRLQRAEPADRPARLDAQRLYDHLGIVVAVAEVLAVEGAELRFHRGQIAAIDRECAVAPGEAQPCAGGEYNR